MSKKYVFHNDPGHGWLAVKRKELERLGILNEITPFSYQKGNTVYLEEDCDYSTFYNAKIQAGEALNKDDIRDSYQERSPILSYRSFSAT